MSLHDSLEKEPISRLAHTTPLVVHTDDALTDTIERMRDQRAGCIMVCDEDKLVGIFTERDFLMRVVAADADPGAPVGNFMTPDPLTLRNSNTVFDAIQLMQQGGYRHLPVLDEEYRPLGLVSVKRIVHWFVEHYPTAVYNLPPTPEKVEVAREGA